MSISHGGDEVDDTDYASFSKDLNLAVTKLVVTDRFESSFREKEFRIGCFLPCMTLQNFGDVGVVGDTYDSKAIFVSPTFLETGDI